MKQNFCIQGDAVEQFLLVSIRIQGAHGHGGVLFGDDVAAADRTRHTSPRAMAESTVHLSPFPSLQVSGRSFQASQGLFLPSHPTRGWGGHAVDFGRAVLFGGQLAIGWDN